MGKVTTLEWADIRAQVRARTLPFADVRSEGEFARGAIPGAQAWPVLDNSERAEVGTIYKRVSSHEAVTRGLELFAEKSERYHDWFHAQAHAGGGDPGRIAVYCWRGGMRSRMVALWLAALGYDPVMLRGGYKRYRAFVLATLDRLATHRLLVLDGMTGSGKTDLLRELIGVVPSLDLEGLAHHRGSAFGDFALPEPPPPQQDFENRMAEAYLEVQRYPELLVEIETYIGPRRVPPRLRATIIEAEMVLISRDFDDRVERLAAEYCEGWDEARDALFVERAKMLHAHLSKAELDDITSAVLRRDFRTAVALLLRLRYDKVYAKGLRRREQRVVASFNLTHESAAAHTWLRARLPALASGTPP